MANTSVSYTKPDPGDEIVITGVSGKFPLCDNVYELRDNLMNKIDMVVGSHGKLHQHPELPKYVGKMPNTEKFDPGYFGITSVEADYMDPLVRIVLEETVQAIIDAGYHPSDLSGSNTGVFASCAFSDTEGCIVNGCYKDGWSGSVRSMVAKWPSYHLKLKGPSVVMDTVSSSSGYAFENAYAALRTGICDKAIVTGVNLCLQPETTIQLMRLGPLSLEGKSKPFDDSADGYVRGESIAVLLLEKAKDAKRIYAEVIHARTNADGYNVEGISFPSTIAQRDLIETVFNDCQMDPNNLTFMEAHGTGTRIGDAEELNAIDTAICKRMERPLYIGSIKSSIGHTETTAGICGIIKVILAMETGYISPNLHYNTPKRGVEGLAEGRMIVVTEKIPLPNQNGVFAVGSIGFGGANAHILLRWNPKVKINKGQPDDDLPRLICVSSRVSDGINSILDDFSSRTCDAEHAYLIQQAFRKPYETHRFRGYGIYSRQGQVARSLRTLKGGDQHLYVVFSNFDDEWCKLGREMMSLPIFSKTIEKIQDIVSKIIDINLFELLTTFPKESLINETFVTVLVQIGCSNILKEIKLTPHRILGVGSGELAAAYMDNYLTFEQTVLGLLSVTSNLTNSNNNKNLAASKLDKTLSTEISPFEKWTSVSEKNLATYSMSNLIETKNTGKLIIPEEAVLLVVGGEVENVPNKSVHLVRAKSKDPIMNFLHNLGSLYEFGFDMEVNKLYQTIQLPVSRATPMLSPLIKWHHTRDCLVFCQYTQFQTDAEHYLMHIIPKIDSWNYLLGHVIEGRHICVGTAYLYLVWLSLARILNKTINEMRIVFEDIRFLRATTFSIDSHLEFFITIQLGAQTFEIVEGNVLIATGKVYEQTDDIGFTYIPFQPFDENNLPMDTKDIYKELHLRGYNYSGKFKAVKKCNVDMTQAIVEWEDNWVSYLDCIYHPAILWNDSRDLYLPISIERIIIDAPQHYSAIRKHDNMMQVHLIKEVRLVRTAGIELMGLQTTMASKKKLRAPVLETSKFLPNETRLDVPNSIRSFVQIILENANLPMINVIEVCAKDQELDQLLYSHIQTAVDDIPLVQQNITIMTDKKTELEGVVLENQLLNSKSNCLILIVSNILETTEIAVALNVLKDANGFVISREKIGSDLSKFNDTPFKVICNHINEEETLVLLRPTLKTTISTRFLDLSNAATDFAWLSELQGMLNEDNVKIVLYAQNEMSGILGFINCLKREYDTNKIACVFVMDDAPKFDPELDFYRQQLDKNLAISVWKDRSWGTYRHLALLESNLVENEYCYVNITTRGDLSTLKWKEGMTKNESKSAFTSPNNTVHIYYAPLNFRDLMTASGRLPPDAIAEGRMELECVEGLEYAGRNVNGERVIGLCMGKGIATLIESEEWAFLPDDWTMEDGATVGAAYMTVLEALDFSVVMPGQSILIHSATGGVGLAAINLCLYYGLQIFATVGGPEKREYLMQNYPQIKEEHIGNSRDTSFEEMIETYTNGKGVDYVLNSLVEEKLMASLRCLARGGTFVEIGKFDMTMNNTVDLELLAKEAAFKVISVIRKLSQDCSDARMKLLSDLIKAGAIKPLPRTVFQYDEIQKAFRYLGAGKHIGKVLIKIRDEENEIVCPVPRTLFKTYPRFYCKPECSYVICGGLGGFGLELTDLLILRGARNIILTSKTELLNGYQQYRIRVWKQYDARVITSTLDASNEEDCAKLLDMANKLAPVDGIFNLAVVLKDAMFENQNVEDFKTSLAPKADSTKNLDKISRKICPQLRHFVVFSSESCGRGNAGQTNYGMSNSIMERICEKRKRDGYPALAIQWGAIGDVGLIVKNQEEYKEVAIGGTLQQKIANCLYVMDNFMRQNETIVASMLIADKRKSVKADNMFDVVINIIGLNPKTISMYRTLPDYGVDSMMTIEIKQTLEREYKLFLTPNDIREMTLVKLKQISNDLKSKRPGSTSPVTEDVVDNANLLLRFIGSEDTADIPVMTLNTPIENEEECRHIWALPGLEGSALVLQSLAAKIKGRIFCLQYTPESKAESITQLAESLLTHFESSHGDLILLAYSFGCVVAIELLHLLKLQGRSATIICIDGSPGLLSHATSMFPIKDDNLFQATIISFIMARFIPQEELLKHKDQMMKFEKYETKIDYALSVSPTGTVPSNYFTNVCLSYYNRIKAAIEYKPRPEKLDAHVFIFKPTDPLITKMPLDYGLSEFFTDKADVIEIPGNHVTILESDDLANHINKILEETK